MRFGNAVGCGTRLLAQISVVDAPDTVEVYLDELELSGFDFAKADWGVANEGSESLAVMVTRTFVDTVSPFNYPFDWANTGSYERFCWGPQCYNFGSNNSALAESFLVNIDTGQVDMSFQSDFYPAGVLGSTTLEYCFHEVDALESGVCHRVTYVVDASVRIDGPEDLAERGMAIAPNPASASTTITVDASNKGSVGIPEPGGSNREVRGGGSAHPRTAHLFGRFAGRPLACEPQSQWLSGGHQAARQALSSVPDDLRHGRG